MLRMRERRDDFPLKMTMTSTSDYETATEIRKYLNFAPLKSLIYSALFKFRQDLLMRNCP